MSIATMAGMALVKPDRRTRPRLALAVLAGVLAAGSAVALLATSAWLITTAAAQPPVLILMVAIVAVRAFGVGRGFFRYVERLAAHDAAYRVLGETRSRITGRMEELAAKPGCPRSGAATCWLVCSWMSTRCWTSGCGWSCPCW